MNRIIEGILNFFKDIFKFSKWVSNTWKLRNKILLFCFLVFAFFSMINFLLLDTSPTTPLRDAGKVVVHGWTYLKSTGILTIFLGGFMFLIIGVFFIIVVVGILWKIRESNEYEKVKKQND